MMQPYKNYDGDYSYSVQEFGGINEKLRIGENEFSSMENMSLKESPVLTVRDKRVTLDCVAEKNGGPAQLAGIGYHGKHVRILKEENEYSHRLECNLYVDGTIHVLSANYLEVPKNDAVLSKTIVGMGANVIVLPDKVSFDIQNSSTLGYFDYEVIENFFERSMVSFEPCTLNGEVYNAKSIGSAAPSSPSNGDVWVDTSKETSAYKVWDSSTKQWVGVSTTYIKVSCEGIGNGFKKWDSVDMDADMIPNIYKADGSTLFEGDVLKRLKEQLNTFINFAHYENKTVILYDVQQDYLVVSGLLDQPCKLEISISREMIDSPFYFEHNNRLWGCMYGDNINEIRASKQGDCCNWNSYLGISTDSYAVTVGAPGDFTGGISFGGYPLFFKENCIIKVYGNLPSNYQLITTPCMGVEKGMEKSLVIANGVLFYKSPSCFCAYDGSMPVNISKELKNIRYSDIKAGATDSCVYFACTETSGERYILVFDIESGIWSKESVGEILAFVRDSKNLNFVERIEADSTQTCIKSIDGTYDDTNIGDAMIFPEEEGDVKWFFESGDIGLQNTKLKYTKKLVLRADVEAGAYFKVYVSCDNGPFVQRSNKVMSPGLHSVSISLGFERCEKFRYRIEGVGKVDFYSIDFEMKEGSER